MGIPEHIKEVIENSNIGILSLDLEGNILFCNKGVEKITNYSSDNSLNKNIFDIVPSLSKKHFKAVINKIKKGEEIPPIILKKLELEDRTLDILYAFNPIIRNNEITGVCAVFRDITNQKEINEVLNIKNQEPATSRKKSFEELRARILIALLKQQMTINQIATAANINWKTVESHLTYLTGKGFTHEVFKSEYIRIFKITELGKEYLRKIRMQIVEKYVTILDDYPNLLKEEIR